jgi:hypothetical protein
MAAGGVVIHANDVLRDGFAWWSEIVIPSLVGLATVGVSVVAVVVSVNASRLARAVEDQRRRAEEERARDAGRARLQEMAIAEARALHRWVVEVTKPQAARILSRAVFEPNMPETSFQKAEVDAIVALEQSLVPGAPQLLELTQFDIENLDRYIRFHGGMGSVLHPEYQRVRRARLDRTFRRIREWAVDPEAMAPVIASELASAQDDAVNYLLFGESLKDFLND